MEDNYQRMTEQELDLACQKFVEKEFPKAVKAVNRFSGKGNQQLADKVNPEPRVKGTGVDRHV